jgi:hypothetical protein
MARPHRGKRRRDRRDWLTDFLITGVEPDKNDPDINPFEVLDYIYDEHDLLREAWSVSHIMRDWNQPGLRPYAWWKFDAPRLPLGSFPGCYYDGELPEPRRHLRGPGQPVHAVSCISPSSSFGIWNWYGDPADPPVFETQFEYLTRHGLLLPGEDEPLPETHPLPPAITDAAEWERIRNLPRTT